MTAADRLLCALVATFAPGRAGIVAGRLARSSGSAPDAAAHAGSLASLPRHHRLTTLSSALAAVLDALGARDEATGPFERPRIAAVLAVVRSGGEPPRGVSPALVRLCRERWRP